MQLLMVLPSPEQEVEVAASASAFFMLQWYYNTMYPYCQGFFVFYKKGLYYD